jgi:pSer/pThr/pTyr-binding forkhead associated (FHA) protein
MISPPAPVTSPAGAANLNLDRTSSRRRGLSYLRALSHSRSGNTSPNEPSRSPRHYFQRSLSYHNDHRPNPPPAVPSTGRRRSHSRPNEPTSPLAFPSETPAPRPSSPPLPSGRNSDPTLTTSSTGQNGQEDMARHRSSTFRRSTTSNQSTVNDTNTDTNTNTDSAPRPPTQRSQSARATWGTKDSADEPKSSLPTIRFHPHQEIRNGRPSLTFSPVSRTLPSEHSIIRVGRYSEREGVPSANPTTPSDAPVGFKSKVVSRKHCEFCFVDGQWQIKDVASSSGTFLNHIRLSQPNTESRLFPIKDGDIVQLGIDFRGGEEMIFRCVKIRIECNRAWQKKPNNFKYVFSFAILGDKVNPVYSKTRHQQLQSLAKDQPTADANSGECSICLGSVLVRYIPLQICPCKTNWLSSLVKLCLSLLARMSGTINASVPF